MSTLSINEEEIREFIAYRYAPEDIINLRYKVRSGTAINKIYKAKNVDSIIKDIHKAESDGQKDAKKEVAAYWLNTQHIKSEFIALNKNAISNEDVDQYTELFLDFDAVKPEKFKNWQSTDAEKEQAYLRMEKFNTIARELGWPEPIRNDSGNGYQSKYLIAPSPVTAENVNLIEQVMASVNILVSGCDTTMSNPGRVGKLPGTPTRRYTEETEERPYREAHVISYPVKKEMVTVEQLQEFLTKYPAPVVKVEASEFNEDSLECARAVLNKAGIPFTERKDGETVYLDFDDKYCPNHAEHSSNGNKNACKVIVTDRIGYQCWHDHCKDLHWVDFRKHYDPIYKRNVEAPYDVRDTPVVEWIMAHYDTQLLYIAEEEEFYFFNGKRLQKDTGRESLKFIEKVAKDLLGAYKYQVRCIPDNERYNGDKLSKKFLEATERLEQSKKYLDIVNQKHLCESLKSKLVKSINDLDKNKCLMNFNNGVYDLRTHTLMPHDPKYLMSLMSPVDIKEKATCPKFIALLKFQFPDEKEQKFIRYVFSGALLRVVRKNVSNIYFFGKPNAGKSTLLLAIAAVLGTDASGYAIIRSSDFNTTRNAKKETRDDRLQTRNKALIAIDEVRKNERQDSEAIKASSGGAQQAQRGLYKADETINPTATTVNTCNDLPKFDWSDEGLVNRLTLVEFNKLLTDIKDDKPYWQVLFEEEGSGILNWLIEGLKDFQLNNAPEMPQRFIQTKQKCALEGNWIDAWVRNTYIAADPEIVENRKLWSEVRIQFEDYCTQIMGISKQYIPKKDVVINALKKLGIEYVEDKTEKIKLVDAKGNCEIAPRKYVLKGLQYIGNDN